MDQGKTFQMLVVVVDGEEERYAYAICASLTCIHRKVTTPRPLSRGRTEQSGGKFQKKFFKISSRYEKWKEPDLCRGEKHVHGLTIY